ncbi:hypothetical protein [Rathayibacter oskolensis]|uniref:hypothetical protein n=1 Tax=Rathayibacter oskolensis TaxID=1891671 RepID=UPI00101ADCA0|nr:hypothetical protein [Rathayibacter oskolensis]
MAELIVNFEFFVRLFTVLSTLADGQATDLRIQGDLSLGVSDADAVVVATALLVLVATINVALAALQIGDRSSWSRSARAFFVARDAQSIAVLAGATSLSLAATRIQQAPGTALLLLLIACVTIMAGRAISEPRGVTELTFRKEQLSLDLSAQKRSLEEALEDYGFTPYRAKPVPPLSALLLVKTSGVLAAAGAGTAGVVVVVILGTASSRWEDITVGAGLLIVATFVLIASLYTFAYYIFFVPCIVFEYFRVRDWKRRTRLAGLLYTALALAWIASVLTSGFTSPPLGEESVMALIVALPPVVMPPLLLAGARLLRRAPGRATVLLVPSILSFEMAESTKEITAVEAELNALLSAQDPR